MLSSFCFLGVPTVQLDAQGRARPSLRALYSWRYEKLGDLEHVLRLPEFRYANPGFLFEYQLIDVPDYLGQGETAPSPYFYQVGFYASFLCKLHSEQIHSILNDSMVNYDKFLRAAPTNSIQTSFEKCMLVLENSNLFARSQTLLR